jgi:GTP pyrophosphokinase
VATTVYSGHTRDQGTPYLHHPLAVVGILRSELSVTTPETLILGLLHDALEVSPVSGPFLEAELGQGLADRLRAMTPDHRLQQRAKRPGDESAWRAKTAALDAESLLVRFADRVHNLRDLRYSPNAARRERFVAALTEFYLPLSESLRGRDAHLDAACALLRAEYECHRRREPGTET